MNKCHEIYLEQKFTQIEKKTKNYEEELEQVHTNRITTPSASNNRQQQHVIKVYVHSTIVFELFRKKKKHFFLMFTCINIYLLDTISTIYQSIEQKQRTEPKQKKRYIV